MALLYLFKGAAQSLNVICCVPFDHIAGHKVSGVHRVKLRGEPQFFQNVIRRMPHRQGL